MPEYLSPGVYIEEFEIGAKPIEGVSTSTCGFLGETERGPTTPRLITSWLGYQRVYGNYFGSDKYLPYSVQGFFDNGGQRCYIGRIAKSNAVSASMDLKDANNNVALTIESAGEGDWGNRILIKATPGTDSGFKLSIFYWKAMPDSLYDPDKDTKTTPRPTLTEVFDNISVDEKSADYYGKIVNGISNLVEISNATGIDPEVGHKGTVGGAAATTITLASGASSVDDVYVDMRIEITSGTGSGQTRKITAYTGTTHVATVDSAWTTTPNSQSGYSIYWFSTLEDGFDSLVTEGTAQAGAAATITLAAGASSADDTYNGMTIEITSGTGNGQIRTIADYVGSTRISTVSANWATAPDNTSVYRIFDTQPDLILADYERTDTDSPGERKGLTGFGAIDDISIIYSPNPSPISGLTGALITHCERLKDRFAIIDAAKALANVTNITPRSDNDTKYGAFYYPWIKVIDPEAGVRRLIPPGGHVAGIYARSDTERGVHKAPANEVVRGAVDLEFQITKGEHDVLNPKGVNVIRAFPGRGIRVWGARGLSSDPLWKYVNVRRLFIFLEKSIERGTQWVVFEPNDPKLWARVRATITGFLTTVWRDGALFGRTPEEAFFVKCDETTMTPDDIDNGKLIVIIGVAPVKPAEFVIFRIAQWRSGSETSE